MIEPGKRPQDQTCPETCREWSWSLTSFSGEDSSWCSVQPQVKSRLPHVWLGMRMWSLSYLLGDAVGPRYYYLVVVGAMQHIGLAVVWLKFWNSKTLLRSAESLFRMLDPTWISLCLPHLPLSAADSGDSSKYHGFVRISDVCFGSKICCLIAPN